MIDFLIPCYTKYPNLIKFLWILQLEDPELFIDNHRIGGAYDFIATSVFNGGRFMVPSHSIYADYAMYKEYDELEIPLHHTCTNTLLTKESLYDTYGNQWLAYTENARNRVICNLDIMVEHIKKNYPKFGITYSTTREHDKLNTYNNIAENDIYVLDYNYNLDDDFLSKITHPERIEIVCAEPCALHCPNRKEHYRILSSLQMGNVDVMPYAADRSLTDQNFCQQKTADSFYSGLLTHPHSMTNERIDELYKKFGYCHYKISGRTDSLYTVVNKCLYYLIKPEYREIVGEKIHFVLGDTGL